MKRNKVPYFPQNHTIQPMYGCEINYIPNEKDAPIKNKPIKFEYLAFGISVLALIICIILILTIC